MTELVGELFMTLEPGIKSVAIMAEEEVNSVSTVDCFPLHADSLKWW